MDVTGKDERLVAVVRRLREDLGRDAFVVVDHWDADLLAIGLARPEDPAVLVYVAVARDGLFFECEVPAGESYKVTARQEGASYEDLRRAVAAHLRSAATGD